jgi:hypothetical protein
MSRLTFDREAIEAEIDRVRSRGLDALRTLWRTAFRSPPSAFGKDILARFLCWHIQEQAFGELDSEIEKHLGGLARGDRSRADRLRRLKPGTVLLREYQGERHTVIVVANGYVWREAIYASLSTIARAITGGAAANLRLRQPWPMRGVHPVAVLFERRPRCVEHLRSGGTDRRARMVRRQWHHHCHLMPDEAAALTAVRSHPLRRP